MIDDAGKPVVVAVDDGAGCWTWTCSETGLVVRVNAIDETVCIETGSSGSCVSIPLGHVATIHMILGRVLFATSTEVAPPEGEDE